MKAKGIFEAKSGGYGFVRREEGDIFVPAANKNGAVHGQEVEVEIEDDRDGKNDRGIVTAILSPPPDIVGTVERSGHSVFVVPEDKTYDDIYIPGGKDRGAKRGDKVVVKIEKYAAGHYLPEGRISEILGRAGEKGVDMLAAARSFGLNALFPKAVEKQARGLKYLPADTSPRLDLREKTVFTIDGADAKDLDDAVSVEKGENGGYILGVHIADVSHYVKEDDVIDKEALKRGTSVYFPGSVIPMLPKTLSNDLCSLNPNEDKLTLSCIMEISDAGDVVWSDIRPSIIRSCARLIYDDVNTLFNGGAADCSVLKKELFLLRELSFILRRKRYEKGSIDFELGEPKIILDEAGETEDIYVLERGDAEKLIEECMLLANMTVAQTFRSMECPFIYRVHERPDTEKMRELGAFLSGFGIPLKASSNIHPKTLQHVLSESEGRREHNIINRVTLRSLKKARYDCLPQGHFGLAAEDYCHFTSPIRRYPDLAVHRIIKTVIAGGMTEEFVSHAEEVLPHMAYVSSERERNAVMAERAAEAKKMAEYMSRRIGETYTGVISGVVAFGLFVELENMIEGVIPFSELTEDYFEADRKNYRAVGEHTGKEYRLGDVISVMCVSVDMDTSEVWFAPC